MYCIISYAASAAAIAYSSYRSYDELDEDIFGHDDSYEEATIHEIFLVLRYLSTTIAVVMIISTLVVIVFTIQIKT